MPRATASPWVWRYPPPASRACPMVCPKFRSARTPCSVGSAATMLAFTSAASVTDVRVGPLSPRSTPGIARSTCAGAVAPDARRGQRSPQTGDGVERLRALAPRKPRDRRAESRPFERAPRACGVAPDGGLGDDSDPAAPPERASVFAELVDRAGADD